MKLGVFMEGYVREDSSPRERLLNVIEQAQLADEAGLHSFGVSEQHFKHPTNSTSAPEVILAAIAQATKTIRIQPSVVVLPLHHPLTTAERWAMIDILSEGRVDLGIGRGNTPLTADAFDVPIPSTEERTIESIEILLNAWLRDSFAYEGKYWSFPELAVTPKPVQEPHPPIYWAATSPGSHETGGRLGFGLMTGAVAMTPKQVGSRIDRYRQGVAAAKPVVEHQKLDGTSGRVICLVLGHCSTTHERARAESEAYIVEYVNRTVEMYKRMVQRTGKDVDFSASERFIDDFDALLETGGMALGAPEDIIETMGRYHDFGVDEMIIRLDGPTHKDALDAIRLLGEYVVPSVANW